MKKILFAITILLSSFFTIYAQQKDVNLNRIKIAVIPSEEGKIYTSLLERSLGKDNRFDFLDQKKIPEILKEWERRQAGLTEEDDTSDLELKNVDFLVKLQNIIVNEELVIEEIENEDENPEDTSIFTILTPKVTEKRYWVVTISADLVITNIAEGGSSKTIHMSARSSDSSQTQKQKAFDAAIRSLELNLYNRIKKVFPIRAFIADMSYKNLKIMRGEKSGVRKGQRYYLQKETEQKIKNKSYKKTEKAGLIQITKVYDEYSDATIIMADSDLNENKIKAEESFYSGVTFEFFGGGFRANNSSKINDNYKSWNFEGGLDLLLGKNFQFGLGTQFGYNNEIFRASFPELQFRYNFHIVRRFYLNIGVIGNVEYATRSMPIRVKDGSDSVSDPDAEIDDEGRYYFPDEEIYVSAFAFSAYLYAGFKFHLSYSTFFFAEGGYRFASKYNWTYSAPEDTEDQHKLDSIENYNDYFNYYSPGGITIRLGLGITI